MKKSHRKAVLVVIFWILCVAGMGVYLYFVAERDHFIGLKVTLCSIIAGFSFVGKLEWISDVI